MPIEIAKGLPDDERERQILRGVMEADDEGAGVPETDLPAHVRPALWMLAHQGRLVDHGGQVYSITPNGEERLEVLDAAAEGGGP